MSAQLGAINSVNAFISKAFKQPRGNFAERVNSTLTVGILAVSSVLLLSSHYWGDPITCWVPAQFTKQWTDFVNQYCYVHGTYFVPLDKELSTDDEERRKDPINYYQWVPYVLAVQAFLFYIPRFLWKSLCRYSGFDLSGAIQYVDAFWNTVKTNDASFKSRIGAFEGRASVFLWDGIRLARKRNGRDLAFFYLFSTIFQALNAWIQWYILNTFLQSSTYTFWGPNILLDLINGVDWQETGHFPRIVHCDFQRRRPASVQLDTVLCVLTLNIYYEKFCIFLWFWLFFVAIVSTLNAIHWMHTLCTKNKSRQILSSYLATSHYKTNTPSNERFFRCLGNDGLFIMQQMALNLGDIPSSYLTIAMRNICNEWDETDEKEDEEDHLLHKTPLPRSI